MDLSKERAVDLVALDDALLSLSTLDPQKSRLVDWALAAVLKVWERDWRAAETHLRRAVEVAPNDAGAHQAYGTDLVQAARFEEGIAEIRRALELIPLSPGEHETLGWALINARRYDEAIVLLQKALRLKPNFPKAHHSLGLAYLHQGRYREALSEINQAIQLSGRNPNLSYLGTLGYLYAVSGKRAEAERVLAEIDEIAQQQKSSEGHYARWPVYLGLGEKEKVWACLEAMYAERVGLGDVRVNPLLDSLRSDPRFADLLRRGGFPP
jgi:Flp pilus assembly protein TadD